LEAAKEKAQQAILLFEQMGATHHLEKAQRMLATIEAQASSHGTKPAKQRLKSGPK
jgi:hypothetical protein